VPDRAVRQVKVRSSRWLVVQAVGLSVVSQPARTLNQTFPGLFYLLPDLMPAEKLSISVPPNTVFGLTQFSPK